MSQPNSIREVAVVSPACLPLGAVLNNGQPALLGVTLLYPPIQMFLRPLGELSVTGARAPLARAHAQRWFQAQQRPPKAEVEIELAIPAQMGLGSDALLGFSLARGLSALAGQPANPAPESVPDAEWQLEANCHSQGGLQLVNLDGAASRRHALQHDEKDAWVFVLYLPRTTNETPADLELQQRQALLKAAPSVTTEVTPLWAALEADDIQAFANQLLSVQDQTAAALANQGVPVSIPEESQRVIQAIRQTGGLAWGQSFGGLAIWGLYHGAAPSQQGRILMRRVVGYDGGSVTAAITDNQGVKLAIQ